MKTPFLSTALDSMRQLTDDKADDVIAHYFPAQKADLQAQLAQLHVNQDLEKLEVAPVLTDLIQEMKKDAAKGTAYLSQGQAFFNDHASDIMLLLGFLSLPYCYAAAKGAEVLVRSKRIVEQPAERLAETAHFVFDVFHKNAFQAEGRALVVILKVRLMHAASRWYVSQGPWDTEELGQPVNQEDMAGTNLSFSLMVIRGLRRMGKLITGEEALTYIQYWNYIGKLLGLKEELLPQNNKEANQLEKAIRKRQFASSDAGQQLTSSLVSYYYQAAEGTPLEGKVNQMLEFLLGEPVCNLLGLKTDELESSLFKPYTLIMKLQNQLLKKNDSYQQAWFNYQQQSKDISPDSAFSLP